MKRITLFLSVALYLFSLTYSLGQTNNLWIAHVITEKITIKLPNNLFPLPPNEVFSRHATKTSPLAAYTNDIGSVDLLINHTNIIWGKDEKSYDVMKSIYKANIIALYDEVVFEKEEFVVHNNKTFLVFEFSSIFFTEDILRGKRTIKKYNYILYTTYKDKILIISFSCPIQQKSQWKSVAHKLINEIEIK